MPPHRVSHTLYRALLRAYPREFRARFGHDLEADFLRLLTTHGRVGAWRRTVTDLLRALPLTYASRRADERRVARLGAAMVPSGGSLMASVWFDLRHALRTLARAPVFTFVTVMTLALGIGANSAMFSLVNAVLLRPMGYERPERLMLIHEAMPQSNVPRFGVSPPDFLDLAAHQRPFSRIGAFRTRAFELSGDIEPEQIIGAQLTASVFPILAVNAALGRTLLPDDEAGARQVAVLSHALWQRRFGARTTVVGERITLDRQPYTIVGVMPATFEFPKRGPYFNGEPADVWLALVFNPFERQARGMFYNHSVIGRLRDGVTIEQATADIAALGPLVRENYPVALKNSPFTLVIQATPFIDEVAGQVRRPLLVLLGAVGLVLLVACANVANLILSRAVTREREIGVRVALGASRQRLFQMVLAEGLALALAGGALGLLLGRWVVHAMPAVIATSLPGVSDVTLDARVLVFTCTLSLLTALIFGAVPLAAGTRRDLNDVLREGAGRATGGRRQHLVQSTLVVTSVAFAFVLLVGAGLLIRSFTALTRIEPGVRADNVLTIRVSLPFAGYRDGASVRRFYRAAYEGLTAIRGVRAAAIATDVPIQGDGERRAFSPDRRGDTGGIPPSVAVTWTYGDYFDTFGIPIVHGRAFLPEEQDENRLVAIVSRTLADRFWTGEDAVGKRLRWGNTTSTLPWMTIVGIVGDVADGPLVDDPPLHVYVPYAEAADAALGAPISGLFRRMTLAVYADSFAESVARSARGAVTAVDPRLAVSDMTTMEQVVYDALAPQRFSAAVLAAFAGGALLLASVGLYGVLAFGVSQRTREIGVRLALGAPPREVQTLIMRNGMVLTLVGLLLGSAGAAAASRLLGALLFDVDVYDPWTFAAVPLLLAVVAAASSWLPARRAANVDPLVALRSE